MLYQEIRYNGGWSYEEVMRAALEELTERVNGVGLGRKIEEELVVGLQEEGPEMSEATDAAKVRKVVAGQHQAEMLAFLELNGSAQRDPDPIGRMEAAGLWLQRAAARFGTWNMISPGDAIEEKRNAKAQASAAVAGE